MNKIYVFGYGSLMNPRSRKRTLPGKRWLKEATLSGYQRKINAPVNGYLYLNIIPNPKMKVRGIIIGVNSQELADLKEREAGYDCVDVSENIGYSFPVFAFIAPDASFPGMKIPRSYLETCMQNMSLAERNTWLEETILENEIEEDMAKPVYANAAPINI